MQACLQALSCLKLHPTPVIVVPLDGTAHCLLCCSIGRDLPDTLRRSFLYKPTCTLFMKQWLRLRFGCVGDKKKPELSLQAARSHGSLNPRSCLHGSEALDQEKATPSGVVQRMIRALRPFTERITSPTRQPALKASFLGLQALFRQMFTDVCPDHTKCVPLTY